MKYNFIKTKFLKHTYMILEKIKILLTMKTVHTYKYALYDTSISNSGLWNLHNINRIHL